MSVLILAQSKKQATLYAEAFEEITMEQGYITAFNQVLFKGKVNITWTGPYLDFLNPEEYESQRQNLDSGNLPSVPTDFKYKVLDQGKIQFAILQKLCNKASQIILAPGSSMEGELLVWETVRYLGVQGKVTKMVSVNSIEVDELKKGFSSLQDCHEQLSNYMNLHVRKKLDWFLYHSATQLYTTLMHKAGSKDTFPIGRTESLALSKVYERKRQIDGFKSKSYWKIDAHIRTNKGSFRTDLDISYLNKKEMENFMMKNDLSEKSQPAIINNVEKKIIKSAAPQLFDLISFQIHMNDFYKFAPSETISLLQSMYFKKYITFPRTNCRLITQKDFEYLRERLSDYQFIVSFPIHHEMPRKAYVDDMAVLEHTALIPTKKIVTQTEWSKWSEKERIIYSEILKRTASMFTADYVNQEVKISVNAKSITLYKTVLENISLGWKALYPDDSSESVDSPLPVLLKDELAFLTLQKTELKSLPPAMHSIGSLIEALNIDEYDLRSSVFDTLQKNSYITIRENQIEITDKGELLSMAIEGTPLTDIHLVDKLVSCLDNGSFDEFVKSLQVDAAQKLEAIRKRIKTQYLRPIGKCPACNNSIVERKSLYGCNGFKRGCTFTISKMILSIPITKAHVKELLERGRTSYIKGFKSQKKNGKKFSAYLILNEKNKIGFEFKSMKEGS